jgi:hypothetical protein
MPSILRAAGAGGQRSLGVRRGRDRCPKGLTGLPFSPPDGRFAGGPAGATLLATQSWS